MKLFFYKIFLSSKLKIFHKIYEQFHYIAIIILNILKSCIIQGGLDG
jgi:hypothetical protein